MDQLKARLIEIKNFFRKVVEEEAPERSDPLAAAAWLLITFVEDEIEAPDSTQTRLLVAQSPRDPTMRFIAVPSPGRGRPPPRGDETIETKVGRVDDTDDD